MQLRDLWLIFRRRWWIILLVAVVATVASVGFSRLQTRVYRSTVQLTVSPSRFDYGLTLVIENLLRQYATQLQTHQLAELVDQRLQLDLPSEKLLSKIRVSPVSDGYLLELTVDDPDPNRARDIAFAWADEFVKQHQIRIAQSNPQDRIEIAMLDDPRPGVLSYPRTQQFAIAAFVLGLVVGAAIAFALEFLDDTVKSSDDVERYTQLALLGVVPSLDVGTHEASLNGHGAKGTRIPIGSGHERA